MMMMTQADMEEMAVGAPKSKAKTRRQAARRGATMNEKEKHGREVLIEANESNPSIGPSMIVGMRVDDRGCCSHQER